MNSGAQKNIFSRITSLLGSPSPSDICIILDIGTVCVSLILVRYTKNSLPEILYSINIPFSISDQQHTEKMQADVLAGCTLAIQHTITYGLSHAYFKKKSRTIEKVLCIFSSPWYASKTKTVSIQNNRPFLITPTFISHLIDVEIQTFEEELKNGMHGEEFTQDVVVLDASIINTKINGYVYDTPLNKKTTECDITLYLGIGSKTIVKKIHDCILDSFSISKQHILSHTFPLVSYSAIEKLFPHTHSYILCHITGEVTDITCVSHNLIGETHTFPSGTFFLVRKIAEAFSVPSEIALSYIHIYTSGKAHTYMNEKIKQVLIDIEREWSIYFENIFSLLQKQNFIPDTMYVVTDPVLAPFFLTFLKNERNDTTLTWRKSANILHISSEILKEYLIQNSQFKSEESAMLGTIFLSHFQ